MQLAAKRSLGSCFRFSRRIKNSPTHNANTARLCIISGISLECYKTLYSVYSSFLLASLVIIIVVVIVGSKYSFKVEEEFGCCS